MFGKFAMMAVTAAFGAAVVWGAAAPVQSAHPAHAPVGQRFLANGTGPAISTP
ncbi:hypothetical protein ABZT03_05605 [Streptomyces sp. NPDC005574]|uniref:hypothetical protein n=1 Tax=Streptomyces sp. NPDC005574 TaxID=3156891 RepID=UPI0033AB1C96